MALDIASLITQAGLKLQDPDHVRWGRLELLGYFNAGQRVFAEARPDQVTRHIEVDLVQGSRQSLPPEATNLVTVTHNISPKQSAISYTMLDTLDATAPNWRSMREKDSVVHFMHDLKDPYVFHVYPPVGPGVRVGMLVSVLPVDAVTEDDPPFVSARWMDALLDYVLFRAWGKDGEYAQNAALSQAHLQLFVTAIGAQSQAAAAMADT